MSSAKDFLGGGGGSEIGDIKPIHTDDILHINENDEHWLRTGHVEDDIASYPDAKTTTSIIHPNVQEKGNFLAFIACTSVNSGLMAVFSAGDPTISLEVSGLNSSYDRQGASYVTSVGDSDITVGSYQNLNYNNRPYVAFCFRSEEGFFDSIDYEGTEITNTEIPHNLNAVPAWIEIDSYAPTQGVVTGYDLQQDRSLSLFKYTEQGSGSGLLLSKLPDSKNIYLTDNFNSNDLERIFLQIIRVRELRL